MISRKMMQFIEHIILFLGVFRSLWLGIFNRQVFQKVYLEWEGRVCRHKDLADEEQSIIEATYVTEEVPKIVAGPLVDLGQAIEFHHNSDWKQIPGVASAIFFKLFLDI